MQAVITGQAEDVVPGSRIVLPWGMMNSVSRVMLIRMVSPGMGMSMMALPA